MFFLKKIALLSLFFMIIPVGNLVADTEKPVIKDKQGNVLVKKGLEPDWKNVEIGNKVEEEDTLKTQKNSTVDVMFDLVNLFRLEEMSELVVKDLPSSAEEGENVKKLYNFSLINGSMVSKLDKLPEETRFSVESPVSIAGARGTAFTVKTNKTETVVTTLENEVEVVSRESINKGIVASPYRRVTVSAWSTVGLRSVGTGVLSESILGKMAVQSVDKIKIRAEGRGKAYPMITDTNEAKKISEKEAVAEAENNLANIISEIKIGPKKNFADLMFEKKSEAGKLFEIVSKARIIERTENSDGSVSVILELDVMELQQMVKDKMNVWKSIYKISMVEYMKDYPALARITTERAAKLDGYRRLAEKIYGTVIASDTFVKDMVLDSDTITNVVQGIVQGAKVIETNYYSDGSVKVLMEIDGVLVANRLSSVSGKDMGENYVSSPELIDYNEYRYFKMIKDME